MIQYSYIDRTSNEPGSLEEIVKKYDLKVVVARRDGGKFRAWIDNVKFYDRDFLYDIESDDKKTINEALIDCLDRIRGRTVFAGNHQKITIPMSTTLNEESHE
jgi:hypothetical protein